MSPALRRLRWIAPLAILALAAVLRFWALGRPDQLIFDELYYVRDAVSQLAHGFPTTWPDKDPAFGGERALAFGDTAATIAHPPLGKWLIGLGILLFGPDAGWGWRSAVAFAGVATVGVTMRLGWLMTRSLRIACLAGLLLAIDGVHVVLSRVGLLDGLLTLFVVLGALCMWLDLERTRPIRLTDPSAPWIRWRRPWLLAAGLAFGAAAAVKWSGLYPLAVFLLLTVLVDLLRRLRAGSGRPIRPNRPILGTALQALATGIVALPAAFAVYLASWTGWIVTTGGQGREPGEPWWVSLWQWHANAIGWHSTLTAEHAYQAHPLTWPFVLRPTAMYKQHWDDVAAVVSPLPNPLVTWAGVLALALLAWALVGRMGACRRDRSLAPLGGPGVAAVAFVLLGYLSGWLPWLLTFGRSAVFQFYAVVLTPFSALALALVLAALAAMPGAPKLFEWIGLRLDASEEAVQGRRISVAVFVVAALVLAVLFWPLWSAMPVQEWFYRAHLWLPGWD